MTPSRCYSCSYDGCGKSAGCTCGCHMDYAVWNVANAKSELAKAKSAYASAKKALQDLKASRRRGK